MPFSNSHIFVVDDDPQIGRSMELVMHSADLSVTVFDSAEAFLAGYDPVNDAGTARCLLLDVRLPGISGLELQQELRRREFDLPIIVLSGNADIPMAVQAVKAGALDFLEKPLHRRLLLERIRDALEQDARNRPQTMRRHRARRSIETLTTKEREVLDLMLGGKSNKQIAFELNVTIQTASKHSARVLAKIGVNNSVDLVRLLGDPIAAAW